nr:MAG TPA: hypothetical protein [Podoviridae sp. ctY3D12]
MLHIIYIPAYLGNIFISLKFRVVMFSIENYFC